MKDPFAFRVSVPLETVSTRIAVRVSPSTSLSFPKTPGAVMVRVSFSATVYSSSTATGASLTAVMVMVTVAVLLSTKPSFAL